MSRCRPEAPAGADTAAEADCRCLCGSLLARLVDGGVELKCRRCKRTHRVPLEAASHQSAPRHPLEVIPARHAG